MVAFGFGSRNHTFCCMFFFSFLLGSQPINFDSPRGGISLVTEKGSTTSSKLLIQKASSSDTGFYSCDPSNANSATVRVHILNGWWPQTVCENTKMVYSISTVLFNPRYVCYTFAYYFRFRILAFFNRQKLDS